jgi:vancomycin resistance protein YoaR
LTGLLVVLAVAFFVASAGVAYAYLGEQKELDAMQAAVSASGFFAGSRVEGIDLSGMEYEEAKSLIAEKLHRDDLARVVRVSAGGKEYSLPIPSTNNLDEVLVEVFNKGREGSLQERYAVVSGLAQSGAEYSVAVELKTSGIGAFLAKIESENLKPAVDAAVSSFDPASASFTFSDEAPGEAVNAEKLTQQIYQQIADEDFSQGLSAEILPLSPSVTREELETQNKKLASFTTKTTDVANRNNNIRLCAAAFNGHVVAPGEVFSVNALTGPRTAAKGYKDAGAIRDGVLIEEPGGGVCQVSSTLFNAVVRAGLEIVERHNHSWPSDYVEIGMDATIDYPSLDFKFRNNSDAPIYLVSSFSGNQLTVSVYGKPILEEGMKITLRSTVDKTVPRGEDIYEFDPSLAYGAANQLRKGRDGKNATTYIQYRKDDKVTEEKVLFRSAYPPIRAKYVYGPGSIYESGAGSAPASGSSGSGGSTSGGSGSSGSTSGDSGSSSGGNPPSTGEGQDPGGAPSSGNGGQSYGGAN